MSTQKQHIRSSRLLGMSEYKCNECTKVQNPRRTSAPESLKAHAYTLESLKAHALLKRTLITYNGKYTEDFRGKTETKEKEACCLTSSHIPVTLNISGIINVPLDPSSVAGIVIVKGTLVKSIPTGASKVRRGIIPMSLVNVQ